MSIWVPLSFHLFSSSQTCEVRYEEGLIAHDTPWDCGSRVAATLFILEGQPVEPRFEDNSKETGTFPVSLTSYLTGRGWTVLASSLTWEGILDFFEDQPNRLLLAHRDLGRGHYVILLGLAQGYLVVADPLTGVRAIPPEDFLSDFSGNAWYFPYLSNLPTIAKILYSVDRRLRLLQQSVAES